MMFGYVSHIVADAKGNTSTVRPRTQVRNL